MGLFFFRGTFRLKKIQDEKIRINHHIKGTNKPI